jgi:hypothetical protein
VFEPLELLEKLAALTPRPRINLVLYHGVLAPHAGWRARVVAYGAPPAEVPGPARPSAPVSARDDTAPMISSGSSGVPFQAASPRRPSIRCSRSSTTSSFGTSKGSPAANPPPNQRKRQRMML